MESDLRERMAAHVEAGDLPGLVALVAGGGDIRVECIGTLGFERPVPMSSDSVFRIASLTKPIVAAAAMTLVDDGTIRLDDAVDDLLPELADRRVLRSLDADLDDTVPARRSITVEDLLTFRLGFGVVMVEPGTYPVQRAEVALELTTLGPPWPPAAIGSDEWIRRFATLPLMHQPGERWMYNTGSQVLGVLIERAAGMDLERFMRARLLDPLDMRDTGFSLRAGQLDRFTTAYEPDPLTGRPQVLDPAEGSWWAHPPAMANAAGWMLSTLDDMWSFVRMMLDGGARDGERILSAASVAAMTTDHLAAVQRADASAFLDPGSGWGYGMAAPAAGGGGPAANSARGFGWDGGTGTAWRSDPVTGITGILLTQRAMTAPGEHTLFDDFWACVFR